MTLEVFLRHLQNGQFSVPNPFVRGAYCVYPLWMAVIAIFLVVVLPLVVLMTMSNWRKEKP